MTGNFALLLMYKYNSDRKYEISFFKFKSFKKYGMSAWVRNRFGFPF